VFTANDADEANEVVAKLTTKGDLLVTTGSALNRLAVGTNAHVLTADSAATNGVKWALSPETDLVTTKGDLLVATAADTLARQGVGTNNHVLMADSGQTNGLKWAAVTSASLSGIGDALTSFTPAWTAVTTDPVLGNGSLIGQYTQINKLVYARYALIPGSTTTFGTGDYRFSFPVAAKSIGNFGAIVSSGIFFDSNLSQMYNMVATSISNEGTVFRIITFLNSTQDLRILGPTAPVTIAVNDQMFFSILYEAA
jgi:hypothetical protein